MTVRWLKDILPRSQGNQNIRVATVNHQTRWSFRAAPITIEQHAERLLDDIEGIQQVRDIITFEVLIADSCTRIPRIQILP
jgi:hypothetical protein